MVESSGRVSPPPASLSSTAPEFRMCPVVGPPRPAMVSAALKRYVSAAAVVVTQHEDTVELVFREADPRWRAAGRSA